MTSTPKRTPCPRRCCGGHKCALDIDPEHPHEHCVCEDAACVCHAPAAYGLVRITAHGVTRYCREVTE